MPEIKPGESFIVTNPQPVGDNPADGAGPLTQSQTLNPPPSVEYGRNQASDSGNGSNGSKGTELPG